MSNAAVKINSSILIAIADKVSAWTGNRFLEKHYAMIESRLMRRTLQLKLKSLEEYHRYLEKNEDEEKEQLISLLTTHHTYFFRESSHFDFIYNSILPELISEVEKREDKTLRILSMACSRGHEVYSLATYLDYNLKKRYPHINFRIIATDVDGLSVNHANNGVYAFEELKRVPMQYLEGYWIRGKGDISNFAKISKKIKDKCIFYEDNLLKISEKTAATTYDIVLCRNVFIYFEQPKIKEISLSLMKLLTPSGFLMVGISESLRGLIDNLVPVGPSIYRNKSAIKVVEAEKVVPINAQVSSNTEKTPLRADLPSPIRVLCVDDSPTIHSVLAKILSEQEGFKIVGKAMNGQEAVDFLKVNSVDAVTLDIHMPVMTGTEYLEKHFNSSHPPVVLMTSVTRENSDIAFKALNFGASDYVEKPTLLNMKEIALELREKIRTSIVNKVQQVGRNFDKQFTRVLEAKRPEECLNIVVGTIGERKKVRELITRSYNLGISTFVVWNRSKADEKQLIESLFKQWGFSDEKKISFGLTLGDLSSFMVTNGAGKNRIVTSVTGQAAPEFALKSPLYGGKFILEETPNLDLKAVKREWNVYPFTSIEYTIFEIFAK